MGTTTTLINLTSSYTPLEAGEYVFKITDIEYDTNFQKLKIKFATEEGKTLVRTYNFLKNDGTTNQGAINMFSWMSKKAMQDEQLQQINPYDLVGHYVKAELTYTEVDSTTNPGEKIQFSNLGKFEKANPWGETASQSYSNDDLRKALGM